MIQVMRELLSDAHMAKVEFHLEFLSPLDLKPETILQLRRELVTAAKFSAADELVAYLDPGLPDDPYARRLFQKPSPPFVIEVPEGGAKNLGPGDHLRITVRFFGNAGSNIVKFARLLQSVGEKGLFKGEGRFELDMIVGRDQAGNQQLLWRGALLPSTLSAPLINLQWLCEERLAESAGATLRFITPARLMSDGKPIFNPCLENIFPFILRRVTSMLYCWSGIELVDDSAEIISAAKRLHAACQDLRWQDWRQLNGDRHQVELGGLVGNLEIDEPLSDPVKTFLILGELMHVGKGAAYGAGQYALEPRC
jgi:hypothetical protein